MKKPDSIISLLDTAASLKPESPPTELHEALKNETGKSFPIKRKHHHVRAYYPGIWSGGKSMPYISETGKSSKASIADLTQQKDFYKLQAFPKKDWTGIKRRVKKLKQSRS